MTIQTSDRICALGVINITPNSFSDGGQYNSCQGVAARIDKMVRWDFRHFDIGAESTAPMNSPISSSEEFNRFNQLLIPNLHLFPLNASLSLDTYRSTTFLSLYELIQKQRPDLNLVWNDVSGQLDEQLWETLEKCPKAKYIFCHSLVPERQLAAEHMNYLLPLSDDIISNVRMILLNAVEEFKARGIVDRLLLDPCFGFSKTMEQNLELIKKLDLVFEQIPVDTPLVIGISKKSFLKKSVVHLDEDDILSSVDAQIELMQAALLPQLFARLPGRMIQVRLHRPAVFFAAHWANCH